MRGVQLKSIYLFLSPLFQLIEGEEEEAYWKESARAKAEFFQRKRKGDAGRGGRGRGGFRSKRGRRD